MEYSTSSFKKEVYSNRFIHLKRRKDSKNNVIPQETRKRIDQSKSQWKKGNSIKFKKNEMKQTFKRK